MSSSSSLILPDRGEDRTTRLSDGRLFGLFVAGHHFLTQVTSKQILPGGCPPSQSRRQLSTLTQSAQSICHSLKIESPLQSVQLPTPSAWWWGWGGGDGRGRGWGGGLALEQSHIPGGGLLPATTLAGVLCLVLAATLEVLLLHNSHESWMSLVAYSMTVSLHKWHGQSFKAQNEVGLFFNRSFSPRPEQSFQAFTMSFLPWDSWEWKFRERKYRNRLQVTRPIVRQMF